MTDTINGLVKKITSKEVGKHNNLAYSLCVLCDDNGEEEWFGHGFDKPICFEGDKVSFGVTYNGKYANIEAASMLITEEGPGEQAPAPTRGAPAPRGGGRGGAPSRGAPAPARGRGPTRGAPAPTRGSAPEQAAQGRAPVSNKPSGGMSKDDFWSNKEKRDIARDLIIQLQSAQNTAIATIVGAVSAGVVALPTKKNEKFDAYIALIDEEALRLREVYLAGGHTPDLSPQKEAQPEEEAQYDDDGPIPE